jgi:pimeloyl-ACP methyl ester carboxylesterase
LSERSPEWRVSFGTDQLTVQQVGSGPHVVLVHGGVGPELTWERQRPLAERWTLLVPTRRGFPGTAEGDRQDFEQDARDVSPLLSDGAHLVGFSYGGVGATILAAEDPNRVKSLTLIEAPLYLAARDHPAVDEIARAGDAFLAGEADELTERQFLADAGIDPNAMTRHNRKLIQQAMDAARGGRPPSEAEPDLDAIAEAGVPAMVVSGDHHEGIEILCDALSKRLRAWREVVPGAGHAVPRAPGFNDVLDEFLRWAETKWPKTA